MQIAGSKNARLGVLFNADLDAKSPGLLFVKFVQITASSYRSVYVKQYMKFCFKYPPFCLTLYDYAVQFKSFFSILQS